jgi:hypothetical protein
MLMMLVATMVSILVHAQVPSESPHPIATDAFDAVPAEERDSLRKAVMRIVELESEGKWDEVYDLVDNPEPITKTAFVRSMRQSRPLISFTPTSVAWVPPAQAWVTTGCAVFGESKSQQTKGVVATIGARRVNESWRLTPVAVMLVKTEPGNVRSCRLP